MNRFTLRTLARLLAPWRTIHFPRPPQLPRLSRRVRRLLALLSLMAFALIAFARGWYLGIGLACLFACLLDPDG